MRKNKIHKFSYFLIFIVIFLSTCSSSTAQPIEGANASSTNIAIIQATNSTRAEDGPGTTIEETPVVTPTAYLPILNRLGDKFLGVYFDQYWTQDNVIPYMTQVDQGAGKKHTAVGWFIDLEDTAFTVPITDLPGNNLYRQLEALWNAGYISFVNMGSNATTQQINSGERDREISYAAEFYKSWVGLGGGRRAMIAPLQEMNGDWTAYGIDPNTSDQYKLAYRHIVNIFAQKGITRQQLWWVFAPNGYNDADKPWREFENYYPGDDVVDIVGFSSFNYGFCPSIQAEWRRWESYPQIFEPYIARMQDMAPTKPIIIAETGTPPWYAQDAEGNPLFDINQMNQWLIENYEYFATRQGVIGVFYFSFAEFQNRQCNMEINPDGQMLSGYHTAVSIPVYSYFNSTYLDDLIH